MMLANIRQSQIWESKDKDRYMKFDEYMRKEALRTEEFVNFIPKTSKVEGRRSVMKAFIESQFAYCPLL